MLASGNGTNVDNFIRYFSGHPKIEIALVISNNPRAYVRERARKANIPHLIIPADQWHDEKKIREVFSGAGIDIIVLAGFLLLIPENLIKMYPGKILNIHPALLPAYGGKGMYGMHVHRAVIDANEKHSGISIHLVNEKYDEGRILFQEKVAVEAGETPESLAAKVQQLEYRYYPRVVESYINRLFPES